MNITTLLLAFLLACIHKTTLSSFLLLHDLLAFHACASSTTLNFYQPMMMMMMVIKKIMMITYLMGHIYRRGFAQNYLIIANILFGNFHIISSPYVHKFVSVHLVRRNFLTCPTPPPPLSFNSIKQQHYLLEKNIICGGEKVRW